MHKDRCGHAPETVRQKQFPETRSSVMNRIDSVVMGARSLVLSAGLAAAVACGAAQGQVKSTVEIVQITNGVEHRVEMTDGKVTKATIDGLEVDHELEDGGVILLNGQERVRIELPVTRGLGGAQLRMIRPEGLEPGWLERDGGPLRLELRGAGAEPPATMIGLTQESLNDQLRSHLGLEEGVGTVIRGVIEGLPAAQSGLKAGDVLIEVDGQEVRGLSSLTEALALRQPGEKLGVVVLRKGTPVTVEITVAAYDAAQLRAAGGAGAWGDAEFDLDLDFPGGFGQVEEMNRAMRRMLEARGVEPGWLGRDGDVIIRRRGEPLVLEFDRAEVENLRRERDDVNKEIWTLIERLGEARGEELDEVIDQLRAAQERAVGLHREFEPQRRELDDRVRRLEERLERLIDEREGEK
jgi:hypothetical protein